jgi:aldehyde:ferredoxin oxidoreductase
MGPDCGIDDLEAIVKTNFLCNEYGLDSITMGATIACAMDLFEAGYVTLKDTGGKDMSFGNVDALVELTRMTANREGIGDKLALGSYRFAESFGHPEFSMTVKKQEMPAYDPRAIQGIGLEYATSNRGGCHVRGYTIAVEILGNGVKLDPHVITDKPHWVKLFQDLTAAVDSSGACIFGTFGMSGEDFAAMLTTLTGVPYTLDDYLKAGERVWNLERMFNLKAGLTSADDNLPERLLKCPIKTGPSKGGVSRLPEMLPEYYRLRGWDEQGVPTPEKLKELTLV